MRKFLYNVMLFAAVCLVGCQSEQLVEGNETEKNTRTIEIFAEMEGEAGSRTVLDGSKGQLKWQAGDQLSVFLSGKQSSSAFTINEGFSPTEATFTGEVQDGGNTLKANVAFYPYNEGVTYNDSESSLTTSISSTQKSNGNGTFAQGVYPMMAVTDGPDSYDFAFKNVLAGTQLYVKGSGQKIVKVVMEVEGQPLAGDYTVGYSNEGVKVTPGENTKNSIELDCRDEDGNGMTLNNGDEYVFTFVHFPMPEADRSVTFTLYEENNTKGTGTLKQLKREAYIGFSSNTFKHIKVSKFDDVPNTVWVADKQNLVDAVKTTYGSKTTVVLAEDVKLNTILEITGSNVVLDGNGKTLNSTAPRAINVEVSATRAINVDGSAKNVTTIKNLTINAAERAINIINCPQTVVVENVTATANNNAVYVAPSAGKVDLTIKDSKLTGLATVYIAGDNTIANIYNTDIVNVDANSNEGYGAVTVWAENAVVNVYGGNITVEDDSKAGFVFPHNSSITFKEIGGNNEIGYIICKIGDYGYETLAEAIKDATDGQTVKLMRDVTINETIEINNAITLDLNGKTVNIDAKDGAPCTDIANHGTMIVKNGKIVAANKENARRCIYNYGRMTIQDVEFTQTYTAKGAAINNEGTMTIENATVNAAYYAIWNSGKDKTLTINNGTFISTSCVENYEGPAYAIMNQNGAKLVVNDGTFTGIHGCISTQIGADVDINGGTFTATKTIGNVTGTSFYALWINNPIPEDIIDVTLDNCTLDASNSTYNVAIYKGYVKSEAAYVDLKTGSGVTLKGGIKVDDNYNGQ